jgi:hypothetical protein
MAIDGCCQAVEATIKFLEGEEITQRVILATQLLVDGI